MLLNCKDPELLNPKSNFDSNTHQTRHCKQFLLEAAPNKT